jgi:hypothetical protein
MHKPLALEIAGDIRSRSARLVSFVSRGDVEDEIHDASNQFGLIFLMHKDNPNRRSANIGEC